MVFVLDPVANLYTCNMFMGHIILEGYTPQQIIEKEKYNHCYNCIFNNPVYSHIQLHYLKTSIFRWVCTLFWNSTHNSIVDLNHCVYTILCLSNNYSFKKTLKNSKNVKNRDVIE